MGERHGVRERAREIEGEGGREREKVGEIEIERKEM